MRAMASTFKIARTRPTNIKRKSKNDYRFEEQGGLNERSAIEAWVRKKGDCPMCRKTLRIQDLVPNFTLRQEIGLYSTPTSTLRIPEDLQQM